MKIKDLEAMGWEVDKTDKSIISQNKHREAVTKTADKIAESIISLNKTAKDMQKSSTDDTIILGRMLTLKIDDLKSRLADRQKEYLPPQKWVFSVQRDTNGFISEVTATRE